MLFKINKEQNAFKGKNYEKAKNNQNNRKEAKIAKK